MQFRVKLEREAGVPASQIETNLAAFLDDLCTHLDVSPTLRARIVGAKSTGDIETFLDSRFTIPQVH